MFRCIKELCQLLEAGGWGGGCLTLEQMESISRLSSTNVHAEGVRQRTYPLDEKNGRADHCVGMYIPEGGPCVFYDPDDSAVRICRLEYFPELGDYAVILVSRVDFAPYIGTDGPF